MIGITSVPFLFCRHPLALPDAGTAMPDSRNAAIARPLREGKIWQHTIDLTGCSRTLLAGIACSRGAIGDLFSGY